MYRNHDSDHVVLIENVWPKIRKDISWFDQFPKNNLGVVLDSAIEADRQRTLQFNNWLASGGILEE